MPRVGRGDYETFNLNILKKDLQFKNTTNPKATICRNKTCVTVQGDVAKFVNAIVVIIAVVGLISTITKAFK